VARSLGRIYSFDHAFSQWWAKHPDLRWVQATNLFISVCRDRGWVSYDPFFVEDEQWIECLNKLNGDNGELP
jgi:hypothetical protein